MGGLRKGVGVLVQACGPEPDGQVVGCRTVKGGVVAHHGDLVALLGAYDGWDEVVQEGLAFSSVGDGVVPSGEYPGDGGTHALGGVRMGFSGDPSSKFHDADA